MRQYGLELEQRLAQLNTRFQALSLAEYHQPLTALGHSDGYAFLIEFLRVEIDPLDAFSFKCGSRQSKYLFGRHELELDVNALRGIQDTHRRHDFVNARSRGFREFLFAFDV